MQPTIEKKATGQQPEYMSRRQRLKKRVIATRPEMDLENADT